MGHKHHHHHSDQHATGNIAMAFFLNFIFTIIEFICGYFTNSLAILSDAMHDLGDSISLGLAWYFQKLSNKKPTKKYSYGFKRFSLLGAIVNSIILVVGSVIIISEAIPRIIHPEEADAQGMMWLALLGIIFNGAAVLRLKRGKSLNERVVMLHLLEDVLGWIAILMASIVMQFWDVPVLDPILSLGIAAFVLFNVFKNIKESIRIILQGSPKGISVDQIKAKLQELPEIKDVHDCHLWTMDGEFNIFTSHIILNDDHIDWKESKKLKEKVRMLLYEEFQLNHVTLELEISQEDCDYKSHDK
jgi:cobalt-zinc-cadmium efflux system protein